MEVRECLKNIAFHCDVSFAAELSHSFHVNNLKNSGKMHNLTNSTYRISLLVYHCTPFNFVTLMDDN